MELIFLILLFTLSLTLSILNRVRGSDHEKIPISGIAQFTVCMILSFLSYYICGSWLVFIFITISYWFGESWGWGKWLGGLITFRVCKMENVDPWENWALQKSFNQVDRGLGIHYIANFFFKHNKEEYEKYCWLALAIRGFFWWVLVFASMYYFNVISLLSFTMSSIIIGICFPLSIEIAVKLLNFYKKEGSIGDRIWAFSELIYGFLHGLIFFIVFL